MNEDETVRAAAGRIILVAIDVDTEKGGELRREFGVRAYPTFMLVDTSGEISDVWIGYGSPAEWTGSLDLALADPATIPQKKERFAAAPDLATAEALARHADGTGDAKAAVMYLGEARKLTTADAGSYDYRIFDAMVGGLRSGQFEPGQIVPAAEAAVAYPGCEPMQKIMVAYYMQRVADKAGDNGLMKPFLEIAIRDTESSDDPEVVEGRGYIMPAYLLHVAGDPEAAFAARKKQLPEDWHDNPDALNQLAWWCFENGVNLEDAMQLALRGVELEQDPEAKANILDTAAAISNARGDNAAAVEMMEKALELNPESEPFKEKLEEYRTVG